MRSPWKILADLASRRRNSDDVPPTTRGVIDDKAARSDLDADKVIEPPEAPTATEPDHALPEQRPDPSLTTPAVDEQSKLPVRSNANTSKASRKVQGKQIKSGSSTKLHNPEKNTRPATAVNVSALDESLSLDAEVKQLRSLLASKLELQNAQLRDLLARYENADR
jgi:hypothetical protein